MPNRDQLKGTSAWPQLPEPLKAALEACPHGLMLRGGQDVLYANTAWKRLSDLRESATAQSAKDLHEARFNATFEGHPVEINVMQDVTARVQLEAQLREAQKLEALGRWVGSIVHDFRNVLTAVMLYSDLLAQTTEPGSVAAKYNAEVRQAARRGTDLVGQLLSFARQRAPEVTVFSLNSLLHGVRDVLRRMSGEDVDLVFDLGESPCRVRVDATQMQQVLFNLAVNSRQAMPGGGRIVIRTRETAATPDSVNAAASNGWVELVISDDGVGMDHAVLARAFEPFFTTKPKGKGTGLGLPTVQSIVTQYGGSVSIDSKAAEGTTVRVLLPRAEAAPDEFRPERVAGVPTGSETILLVEDDSSVRSSMGEMLKRCGYRVLEASAGLDAIRAAEDFEGHVDLLLADMVLPGLSGREIARQIKLGRPDLRVLFISGYEPDRENRRPDVFSKPFDEQALAHKVRQVLDSGPGLSRTIASL